ncbi:NADH-quinone oxidoreductase subunit D-related protein [Rhodococcus aerolatus]
MTVGDDGGGVAAVPVRTRTVGVGDVTRHLGVDEVVDLGPLHPGAHGALRLRLRVAGDGPAAVVQEAVPLVGHLHRGAEKLFEVRDYRQVMALANRHDWWAAFANELLVAGAVEEMTGLRPPPRAVALRVVLAELSRAVAHLGFTTALARTPDSRAAGVAARERLQAVLEEACGGRVHLVANRIGGLREDVPLGWTARVRDALDAVRRGLDALRAGTVDDPGFADDHRGLGVLDRADAAALGVTGPAGRASGLDLDLRRDDPWEGYAELGVVPVVRAEGDALARVACQLDEVDLALDLAGRALDRVPGGPVNVRLPQTIAPGEGSVFVWGEAPLGTAGVHVVSRGERTPWRLKLRTASFNNVQALAVLLPGCTVAELPRVLASFAVVIGDVDK